LKPFLTKSVTSSSMSLNVVTFSKGTGLDLVILETNASAPYFNKYSFASLQSSKEAKKQTSDPDV